jgi:uncharacterized membrane protein (UPF0127 family)
MNKNILKNSLVINDEKSNIGASAKGKYMTNMEIATTIMEQLGGRMFRMMTGAKNFIAIESGLTFKIPRSNNISYVKIILTPMDEYDMFFMKMNKTEIIILKEVNGLFFDQLQEVFTRETGLYTSL